MTGSGGGGGGGEGGADVTNLLKDGASMKSGASASGLGREGRRDGGGSTPKCLEVHETGIAMSGSMNSGVFSGASAVGRGRGARKGKQTLAEYLSAVGAVPNGVSKGSAMASSSSSSSQVVHANTRTRARAHTHTHTHTHTLTHSLERMSAWTHACTQTNTLAPMHACIHACKHFQVYTHRLKGAYVHTYTLTRFCAMYVSTPRGFLSVSRPGSLSGNGPLFHPLS